MRRLHLSTWESEVANLRIQEQAKKHSTSLANKDGKLGAPLRFEKQFAHHVRLCDIFVMNYRPLQLAHTPEFRTFATGLNNRNVPPSPATTRRIIMAMDACIFDAILRQLGVVVAQMRRFGLPSVGMSVDMWTAKYTAVKYLCITIHYIGREGGKPTGKFVWREHVIEFCSFPELTCNAKTIAKCYRDALNRYGLKLSDVVLVSPDGESAGLAALRLLGLPFEICIPHQIARSILYAGGEVKAEDANPDYLAVLASFRQVSALVRKSPKISKMLRDTQLALAPASASDV